MAGNSSVNGDEGLASNERLEHEEDDLHEPDERAPHRAAKQPSAPPAHDASDGDPARLENPPQTDGPRERNNDAV